MLSITKLTKLTKFTGTILALDLATTTGFAWGKPGKPPHFGHIRFAKLGAERARIHRNFRDWMQTRWNVRDHQPELVVYESPASPMIMMGRTHISTIKLLIGLCEHLEEFCFEKFELREASVGQVRAHFIGGNFKSAVAKQMTVDRCLQLGWMVTNDNEADACALWDYQVACIRPDLAYKTTALFG